MVEAPVAEGAGASLGSCASASKRGVEGGGVRDLLRLESGGLIGLPKALTEVAPISVGGGVHPAVAAKSTSSLRRLLGGLPGGSCADIIGAFGVKESGLESLTTSTNEVEV